ncbi:hypothetical protein C8A05DRAFT_40787 [Staphylotrichum tortipilum]|uniref:Zn(2)-C6 fungal-type domain-containing protein n=1 Tax=Staphylotrichum tortipilum TaxID=2831512 RepID=A0AAN6RXR9_9PEZI|nr:hypothetical protein C8A05DRAFT_40787 [Staphylotrichum longicolle]
MPTVPPPVTGSPDQYSVSPFTPLPSIPTPPSPPPFTTAVEPLPIAGFPLPLGNPSFPLPAGSPGYGHGVSGGPAGYQILTREAKDMLLATHTELAETMPKVSRPSPETAALSQVSALTLRGPHPGAVKGLENSEWIKPEPLERLGWNEPGFVPVKAPLPLQPDAGEIESKPASEPDRENARDRKKRFRFDEERLRRETSNTRSMGACLRCHNQRVRCIPNKEDSTSRVAPCETCLKVRRDSKKTIHNIPCLRFKVTSMSIYRPGGLGLTREFTYTMVVDVPGSRDNLIYNIEMTQGLCRDPVRLCVRRFQPKDTDISYRRYMDDGRPKKQDAGAFCLADVERTAKEFNAYLERNALEGLEEAVKGSDDIVKDVFVMIAAHYKFLSDPVNPDPDTAKDSRKSPDQKEFLQKMIRLWFGIRHGLGKAWITSGGEALGTSPGAGPNHPLQGRMSVPRMIVAQFDSIRCERVYKTLAPEVLRGLDTFLTSCNKEAWFTVFLVTFLLLHQVAVISFDRWRYTRENCEGRRPDTRYGNISPQNPLTGWIEDVHLGAVTLLAHWHYFKRCDLMAVNWDETAGESALAGLTAPQRAFVRDVVERVRAKLPSIPATPAEGCWEHELFWVSRMFLSEPSREADWTPPEIFTRDKPSVGRE